MNPVVVIATHNRLSITTANIQSLFKQSLVPKIVLVVSDPADHEYFSQFPIYIIDHPNQPLGAKWQAGVNRARELEASHVIITGSDDILSRDFVERYCREWSFVGFKSWYVLHKEVLYSLSYLPNQCIGGGRVFDKSFLDWCNWKLFDISKNRLLDDVASNLVTGFVGCAELRWPEVLAVKGDWPTMNPLDVHHKNVKLLLTYRDEEMKKIIKSKFDYAP